MIFLNLHSFTLFSKDDEILGVVVRGHMAKAMAFEALGNLRNSICVSLLNKRNFGCMVLKFFDDGFLGGARSTEGDLS